MDRLASPVDLLAVALTPSFRLAAITQESVVSSVQLGVQLRNLHQGSMELKTAEWEMSVLLEAADRARLGESEIEP